MDRSLAGYSLWGCKRTGHGLATKQQQQYSIVYMYYNFFIHSSVNGYLGFFHVLAIAIVVVQLLSHVLTLCIPILLHCLPEFVQIHVH